MKATTLECLTELRNLADPKSMQVDIGFVPFGPADEWFRDFWADARREPLEVLSEVVADATLDRSLEALALLADAPEAEPQPTAMQIAEAVREACAAEFGDGKLAWVARTIRGTDPIPILKKLGAKYD
jgi:hypothetical protein